VKLKPAVAGVWELDEQSLSRNPAVYEVHSEEEAWDAYREAKPATRRADTTLRSGSSTR